MGPKRQRFVGSSSTNPDFDEGFDENKFLTSAGQAAYNRLRGKAVAKERGFKPSAQDGELLAMIEERGWGVICQTPMEVPLAIVRECYANSMVEDTGYSYVRGETVDLRLEAIQRILRLPPRPRADEDWSSKSAETVDLNAIVLELCAPGTVWTMKAGSDEPLHFPASALNRYAKAWNLFICANLMPSTHTHELTVERAILLYGILTGKYVALDYLIWNAMRRYRGMQQARNRPFGQIPFGSIITQLCVRAGVRWGAEEEMQRPMVDIDSAVIARLGDWPGGRPHPRGVGFIVPGAEGAAPPVQRQRQARAGRVSSSQGPGVEFMESQFRRMFRRMDAMHNANRQFAEELTSSLDSVLARDGQQVQWPVYGASHPYPPPDSPPLEEGGDADDQ